MTKNIQLQALFINGIMGRKFIMYGLDTTNEVIQVHFTENSCESTIVRLASKYVDYYQVSFPDGLLENCFHINAYIYLLTDDSGNTTHQISIPVIVRKKPEGFTSQDDPIIQTQIELLIIDITESNKELIYIVNTFLTYIVQTIYLSTIHFAKTKFF